MCCGREHRVRKIALTTPHARMELCDIDAKQVCLETHVIAREQASVAIEGGVLDRLGGDRCAELLELRHCASLDRGSLRIADGLPKPNRKLLDHQAIERETGRLCTRDPGLEKRPVA